MASASNPAVDAGRHDRRAAWYVLDSRRNAVLRKRAVVSCLAGIMSWFSRVKDKLTGKPSTTAVAPAAPAEVAQPAPEPTTGLGFYQRGLARCQRGQLREAIEDLDRALELSPRFAAALTERGLARELAGDFDGALRDFDAAIVADPSYPLAYNNRVNMLLRAKRWADVVETGNLGLRLSPGLAMMRYSRGVAHEMLGDLARALDDYVTSIKHAPNTEAATQSQQRLRNLPERAHTLAKPNELVSASWRVLTGVSVRDTIAELVGKVVAAHAFFIQLEHEDGTHTYLSIYGKHGLRHRLSELADAIGPPILDFRLTQLPMTELEQPRPTAGPDQKVVIARDMLHVAVGHEDGIRLVAQGVVYARVSQPVALFAQPPVFDRSADNRFARTCAACKTRLAYFAPARDSDGKLIGFACPRCGASPVAAWIEDRMRPGGWSRDGFLGAHEALDDVIARDGEALTRLAVTPAQLGHALDRLLVRAVDASRDRLVREQFALIDHQHRAGQLGFDGPARLALGDTLDQLEHRLRDHQPLPAGRGTRIDQFQIFLDAYLGYQHCPYTLARPIWSEDTPQDWLLQGKTPAYTYNTPAIDLTLACREAGTYRHANLEFLIVNTTTHEWLRGAGLHAHLIADHGFFEGPASPFRLDPARAARVLGLVR